MIRFAISQDAFTVTRASGPCALCVILPARAGGPCHSGARPPAVTRHLAAFTLIEMLVATVLAAILMSAVLAMLAGVSRDRKRLDAHNAPQAPNGIVELVRWDLRNAATIEIDPSTHDAILTGNGGIDPKTLANNGRQVQVTYQLNSGGLWRIQEYLDDPTRHAKWVELVANDVNDFSLVSNADAELSVPSHLRLHLIAVNLSINEVLWIK